MFTSTSTKPTSIFCFSFFILILILPLVNAQAQPFRLGKVSAEDFIQGEYDQDNDASAVILYNYGNTYFELDTRSGSFYYMYERKVRLQILNEDGFDWADLSIPLLDISGTRESMSRFRGYVHNLGGTRVTSTRIRSRDGISEKTSDNLRTIKFSFPDIQPGSIVEYRYTIRSPFLYNLPTWQFQYSVPVEYSEYNLQIPEFYNYQFYMQGYEVVDIAEQDIASVQFLLNASGRQQGGGNVMSAKTTNYKWVMSDVPAMRPEPFTTNIRNYLSMIRFELSSIMFPGMTPTLYATSWFDIDNRLREDENFGGFLSGSRQLRQELEALETESSGEMEKIALALNYIHDNIRWNGRRGLYSSGSPRNVLREGTGNAADVNLMLIAALRELGLNADPVISSTRDNGIVIREFPTLSRLNYVLAAVQLDNHEYLLLDATDPFCPPGMIPKRALNGEGRLIGEVNADWLALETSFLSHEKKDYYFSIGQNGHITGTSRIEMSDYAAYAVRRDLESKGNPDEYIESLQEGVPGKEIISLTIHNEEDLDQPIIKEIEFELSEAISHAGDLILFAPMLFEALEENPFRIDERNYPVDYTLPFREDISMIFDIPQGFEVDFLPDPVHYSLPDQAAFSYSVEINEENQIEVTYIFEIHQTMFLPSDYKALQELYGIMVEKQNEQLVFTAI
jgi:transglutaminase-like putative cysteine protease